MTTTTQTANREQDTRQPSPHHTSIEGSMQATNSSFHFHMDFELRRYENPDPMHDIDLARELVDRLNRLCENPKVKEVFSLLIDLTVDASGLEDHPTIIVTSGTSSVLSEGDEGYQPNTAPSVGFLGMLNGLVGVIPDVVAVCDDETGELLRFELMTDSWFSS